MLFLASRDVNVYHLCASAMLVPGQHVHSCRAVHEACPFSADWSLEKQHCQAKHLCLFQAAPELRMKSLSAVHRAVVHQPLLHPAPAVELLSLFATRHDKQASTHTIHTLDAPGSCSCPVSSSLPGSWCSSFSAPFNTALPSKLVSKPLVIPNMTTVYGQRGYLFMFPFKHIQYHMWNMSIL